KVLVDKFKINDIIGKTVIIHDGTDDFKTQPSGNAGSKIACGEIVRI
ncbi:MAG: superoxide dismutase family protein, partial [Clostridia bacterium]|nr:superoxide dismutase family protein [Clostridia bacterium]